MFYGQTGGETHHSLTVPTNPGCEYIKVYSDLLGA